MDEVDEKGGLYRCQFALLPLLDFVFPILVMQKPQGPLDFRLNLEEPLGLGKELVS